MATNSSIIAWKIPWQRSLAKSRAPLSDWTEPNCEIFKFFQFFFIMDGDFLKMRRSQIPFLLIFERIFKK